MSRNEFADDSLETTVMGRYPQPGTMLLGKYRVVSLIGIGGMGVVLKTKHVELDEHFAIKCLLPEMMERTEIVQRFLREGKAAVKLKGEHVARVHDVGKFPETNVPFIVMEYLEGADLNAIIKHHGAQDPAIAVDLILQACEAIAEAHSLGIIHRDIKSSNFFITQPPNQAPILKVLDFGIATAPEGTSELTSTQSVIGTPSYMAPEQMRSSRQADQRSDIWSIGVVLYELLEGARPFRSEVYSELCLKVGMDPPHPMEHPDVPEGLRAIVMRCLEKNMDRRYQSAAELAFDLMPFASDQVAARAAVEQCARLLGRRGSRVYDAQQDPALGRLTPPGAMVSPQTPISSSQPSLGDSPVPTVLGRPTPQPTSQIKTPTSIGGSSGEIVKLPASQAYPTGKRRSGLVVAITAITVIALVGGGALFASSQGWLGGSDKAAATVPSPANEPPTKTEIKAIDEKVDTKSDEKQDEKTDTKAGTKVDAKPDAKPDDKKVEPKKPDDTKVAEDKKPAAPAKPVVTPAKPVVAPRPVVKPPVVVQKPPPVQTPPAPPPPTSNKDQDLYKRRQ